MTSDRQYSVTLTLVARDDLARYRGLDTRSARGLRTLMSRRYRGHPLGGVLASCRSLVLSRSGGGFRAVYIVDEAAVRCVVFAIGPHATVYEVATRRYAALGDEP